jgi:hypothetical protein
MSLQHRKDLKGHYTTTQTSAVNTLFSPSVLLLRSDEFRGLQYLRVEATFRVQPSSHLLFPHQSEGKMRNSLLLVQPSSHLLLPHQSEGKMRNSLLLVQPSLYLLHPHQ